MKFKTLKDLYEYNLELAKSIKVINKEELKQEAIKWIKLCEKEKERAFNSTDENCIIAQINWIKHFFNITEEDLK